MALKIAYWASTIIAAVMLGFALSYLTRNEQVVTGFKHLVHCNVEIGSVIWHHAACLPSQRWSSPDRFVKRLSCAFVRAAAVRTMRGKRG
jgi:hypothetical protein